MKRLNKQTQCLIFYYLIGGGRLNMNKKQIIFGNSNISLLQDLSNKNKKSYILKNVSQM